MIGSGLRRTVGRIVGGQLSEQIVQRSTGCLLFQFLRRAIGNNTSAIDNDGAGAGRIHFFENMGGEKDRLALAETFDQLPHLVFLVRIEAISGFVKNQHFGIVQERLRQAGAMTISLGKGIDRLFRHVLQETGFDRALDCLVLGVAAEIAHISTKFQEPDDGHVVVERSRLWQVADFLFGEVRFIDNRMPANLGIARAGGDEAGDHAHGGGFACAVGPQKAENFAGFDRKGQVVDCVFWTKMFG